jgi:hypothetical protein
MEKSEMSSLIESSLLEIEELISHQNIMLLYYANMGRSLQEPYIKFCIDNPFSYTDNDITNITRYFSQLILKENFTDQSKLIDESYKEYAASRKKVCYYGYVVLPLHLNHRFIIVFRKFLI